MTTFSVPEMSCGHCKAAVEKAIAGIDPAARVTVDLESRTARVETALGDAVVIAAMKEAGYAATVRA